MEQTYLELLCELCQHEPYPKSGIFYFPRNNRPTLYDYLTITGFCIEDDYFRLFVVANGDVHTDMAGYITKYTSGKIDCSSPIEEYFPKRHRWANDIVEVLYMAAKTVEGIEEHCAKIKKALKRNAEIRHEYPDGMTSFYGVYKEYSDNEKFINGLIR